MCLTIGGAVHLSPLEEDLERIDSIPDIGRRTAKQIIAEIGDDLSSFESASHFASWAGLVPGQNESADKRLSSHTREGNKYMRRALVESALSRIRKKDSYLAAKYKKLAARRGSKRAKVAIAHELLMLVYVFDDKKRRL